MGNTEIMRRGDIQMTSTGTGITHSEKTHGSKPVHFLQIWSVPHTSRLPPRYYTRNFTDAEKTDTWARVVAPVGAEGVLEERDAKGPAPVHSQLTLYASILNEGKTLNKALDGKKAYVHVIQTSGFNTGPATGAEVRIREAKGSSELVLKEGDGAYVMVTAPGGVLEVENIGDRSAEILLFDLD